MEEGEAQDSLKVMADKHAVIRSHLEEAECELANKKELLRIDEEKLRLKTGELCIAEQHVRSLNEKLFYVRENYNRKEKLQQELLSELVEIQWSIIKITEDVEKFKQIFQTNMKCQEAHTSNVMKSEESTMKDTELEILQNEVDRLNSLKTRLEEGDVELKRIWTGETLQTIAIQKQAILDAFSERDIQTEMLQAELDHKLEEIEEEEQKIQIEEKQNQARLRLMQKQLQELEETEKHLKSTVEYMEQQVDHGMKN